MKALSAKFILIILCIAFSTGCKKDEEVEEEIIIDPLHASVLNGNKGWSTYAYTEDIYNPTSIPGDVPIALNLLEGFIDNGYPNYFVSKVIQYRYGERKLSSAKILFPNQGTMQTYDVPFALGTTADLGEEYGLQGGIPENLKTKITGSFLSVNDFFVHENEVYASSDVWRKVFNYYSNTLTVKTIRGSNNSYYGWFNAIHKSKFGSSIDFSANPAIEGVQFSMVGSTDLISSSSGLKIMSLGKFIDYPTNNNRSWRACILEKNWNTLTDSVDKVYPLPYNQAVHENDLESTTHCNNNYIFSTLIMPAVGKLALAFGDRFAGMQYVADLDNVHQVIKVVESNNAFFCVYKDKSDIYHATKVSYTGVVSTFNDIPFGDYSHYKGDLIVGTHLVGNQNVTGVYKITSSGTVLLGGDNFISSASLVKFASDGNNLFAAVSNCISPVYKNARGQFCGYEILKFNN